MEEMQGKLINVDDILMHLRAGIYTNYLIVDLEVMALSWILLLVRSLVIVIVWRLKPICGSASICTNSTQFVHVNVPVCVTCVKIVDLC